MASRFVLVCSFALGLGLGCSLADELDGADCESNADCASSQSCVKTQWQLDNGFAGTCRPKGAKCKPGEQAGCECAQTGAELYCVDSSLTPTDPTNAANCKCLPEGAGTTG